MSLAAEARAAVRERPFLYDALRAGIVNYSAAANLLALNGDSAAVAAALRRYAEDLPSPTDDDGDARVRMQSGVGEAEDPSGALLAVADRPIAAGAGADTAVLATGDVDLRTLERALARLRTAGVTPVAAGGREGALVVVVDRRSGADAVRIVESALVSGE